MPKFASSALLDGGLLYLKNNAVKVVLLGNYAAGDSAVTIAANKLAEATTTSADYTIGSSGQARVVTVPSKTTAPATAGITGGNLHVAHLDSSGVAIYVTDETSDQAITAGNPVEIPSHSYTSGQPT
jgi:hypothetical protein